MLKYTSINNEAFWSAVLSVALVAYFYKGSRQMHDAIIEGLLGRSTTSTLMSSSR